DGRPDFLAARPRQGFTLLGSSAGSGPAPEPPPTAYAAGAVPSGARSAPTSASSSEVQVRRGCGGPGAGPSSVRVADKPPQTGFGLGLLASCLGRRYSEGVVSNSWTGIHKHGRHRD